MPDTPSDFAPAHTLGGKQRPFAWRYDPDGSLTLQRTLRRGSSHQHETRSLSPSDLQALLDFMADGQWHPLASGAQAVRAATTSAGIGPFLHHTLAWSAQATALAGHLAAVMVAAGLWEWNGQKVGMRFRQRHADPQRLAAHYAQQHPQAAPHARTAPSDGARPEPPRFDLGAKFRALSRALRGRVDEVDAGGRHHVEKGQRREGAVREFLRTHLPPRYGITRGEAVNATSEVSRQADVLIYDALSAPVLMESDGSRLLAAESLYAAIEIKPRLTVTELRGAIANIRSVKALSRAALLGDAADAPDASPPVFGIIFAFDSMDWRKVATTLRDEQRAHPPSHWIDCVCVLDHVVIHRFVDAPGHWSPSASTSSTPLASIEAGPDSLLYFWRLLLQDLNAKRLPRPDLTAYTHGVAFPPPDFV